MPDREVAIGRLAAAVGGRVDGDPSLRVRGVETDSRRVGPGSLFACVRGISADGHDYARTAAEAGAVALVVERPVEVALPSIVVGSVRDAVGPLAAEFFDHPSRHLTVLGVTGTNGKTTVTHLIAAAARGAGSSPAVLGTLSGPLTTPEAVEVQRRLDEARSAGCDVVAMEVSSHALDQRRVDGTVFEVAVFTNLSEDHLDYHGTMAAYHEAKARLFTPALSRLAVVNVDDPAGRRIVAESALPCVEVSVSGVPGVRLGATSTTLTWRGRRFTVPLGGAFVVDDVVLAAEAAVAAGLDVEAVRAGLAAATPVPGRFEVVSAAGSGPLVVVDYAHTPDALAVALRSARAVGDGDGDVVVVFGCGGDRDAVKRPMMGRVAAELADRVVVTDDNPRGEDPAKIVAAVVSGVDPARARVVTVERDRRVAITQAVAAAGPGDVVVVAGKGHETTQEIAGELLPFDDRAVAREALRSREAAR